MKTVLFGDRPFETELVIFDKDGTLTDFRKTWFAILDKRMEIILREIKLNCTEEEFRKTVYQTYGISGRYIDPYGPFPYTPPWEDEIVFATILYRLGVPWQEGKNIARYSTQKAEEELDRGSCTELIDGVKDVLERLHKSGILISLATADLTDIATDVLKHTGIYDLFNFVIGADKTENNKPHPEMIFKTLEALKIEGQSTAFVGDAITDMQMAKSADLGLVVGVVDGGVARPEDLKKDADVVLNSVHEIRVL